jgi:hypothetical protein
MDIARMRELRNAYKIWSEDVKLRVHLEDLDVDGRII